MGDAIDGRHQVLGELVQLHFYNDVCRIQVLRRNATTPADVAHDLAGGYDNLAELVLNAFALNHLLDVFLDVVFLTRKSMDGVPTLHSINPYP